MRSVVCLLVAVGLWMSGSSRMAAQGANDLMGRFNRPPVALGRFHGTWFNANFIAELSSSRSYVKACGKLNAFDPLWLRIDTTRPALIAIIGYAPDSTDTMIIFKNSVKGAGQKWTLGHTEQPIWMITDDEQKRSYIALTPLDSLEAQPIVMGALPSKNPDPMFILSRMVNNSLLAGQWKGQDGAVYRFTNDLVMDLNGQAARYKLRFDNRSSRVSIITIDGQPRSWSVERRDATLILKPSKGAPLTLTMMPEKN